ncbi:acetylxylan esterase [bacterium]|nr:acetylxylan esterase [bacterium]
MKKTRITYLIVALALFTSAGVLEAADSLPPLEDGKVAQNVKELWAGYDSTREPLEVKVVREWQDPGITYRYMTYTIGTFKGKKATMAAFYGFPTKHKGKLPALIQMHGGGQRAATHSIVYGAGNGYATLSINWGGREMENAKPGDPGTDWGAVDATQSGHNGHYASLMPDDKTLDPVESPRNNNWFLIILAAKRGITFLQGQPEVDPDRIGAFGHSMGGKLTVMLTGADKRIKAGAPSCGGCGSAPDSIRNRKNAGVRRRQSDLYHKTIDDALYIKDTTVPMLYVGPQNDFNGILDIMYANWQSIGSKTVNYTITPHMNHRAIAEHVFAGILFFEDHLKGVFDFPVTPKLTATLDARDGVPAVVLEPDQVKNVAKVAIYYSVDPHILTRFWRSAEAVRKGGTWQASCPLTSTDQPLYIMANVYYTLNHPVVGYPWMRKAPKTFGISSELIGYTPDQLKKAKVKAASTRSRVIEKDFTDYQDWYRLDWGNPHWWSAYTRKIKDPMYAAPDGAKLALDLKIEHDATLFFELQDNSWGAFPGQKNGHYYARVDIKGSGDWQTVGVTVADFKPVQARTKHALASWRHVTELGIRGRVKVAQGGEQVELPRDGSKPNTRWSEPRAFRNLRWEGGTYPRSAQTPDGAKAMSEEERKKQFQKGIDDSIELEKRDKAKQ